MAGVIPLLGKHRRFCQSPTRGLQQFIIHLTRMPQRIMGRRVHANAQATHFRAGSNVLIERHWSVDDIRPLHDQLAMHVLDNPAAPLAKLA